jgi:CBS domain-containing protein
MAQQAHRGSGSRPAAEVMSTDLVTVRRKTTIADVARLMRDHDIGPVVVVDGESVFGVITDRDITVRAVADGQDPEATAVGDVASTSVTTIGPDDTLEDAAEAMRAQAVRRVVVAERGRPLGILSLGDLAQTDDAADDAGEALGHVSAAPPQD